MIENQSDNREKKENVSEESNISEGSSVIENQISEDKHSSEMDEEKNYAEDLKNTITKNCLLYTSPSPRDS